MFQGVRRRVSGLGISGAFLVVSWGFIGISRAYHVVSASSSSFQGCFRGSQGAFQRSTRRSQERLRGSQRDSDGRGKVAPGGLMCVFRVFQGYGAAGTSHGVQGSQKVPGRFQESQRFLRRYRSYLNPSETPLEPHAPLKGL